MAADNAVDAAKPQPSPAGRTVRPCLGPEWATTGWLRCMSRACFAPWDDKDDDSVSTLYAEFRDACLETAANLGRERIGNGN